MKRCRVFRNSARKSALSRLACNFKDSRDKVAETSGSVVMKQCPLGEEKIISERRESRREQQKTDHKEQSLDLSSLPPNEYILLLQLGHLSRKNLFLTLNSNSASCIQFFAFSLLETMLRNEKLVAFVKFSDCLRRLAEHFLWSPSFDSAILRGCKRSLSPSSSPESMLAAKKPRAGKKKGKENCIDVKETKRKSLLFQHLPFCSASSSEFVFSEKRVAEPKTVEKKPSTSRGVPNYFVAIPILNPEIHEALRKVQEELVSKEKRLQQSLISLPTLHITLFVMRLDEEHCLHDAREALNKCLVKIKEELMLTELNLEFEGLGSFKGDVLFAQVKDDGQELQKLQKIADFVRDSFISEDILPSDAKCFQPHLTIAKLSKMDRKTHKKVKKIKPEWYEESLQNNFGAEKVKTLQICSMLKKKDANGYYYCAYYLDMFDNE